MDPTKQECFSRFLYGAGYYSRDENNLALALSRSDRPNFCQRCPRHTACEEALDRRVRATQPEAAEAFDRIIREAKRRGASPVLVKLLLGRNGKDPFAAAAVENFNQGHADRGKVSGLIVHSDADPRRS